MTTRQRFSLVEAVLRPIRTVDRPHPASREESCRLSARLLVFVALVVTAMTTTSMAQTPPPADLGQPGHFRKLAPGVVKEIGPEIAIEETFTGPRPLVGLLQANPDLAWQPNFYPTTGTLASKAGKVVFRRSIWALEFGFKPVRMIDVSVPGPTGKRVRKKIWYLVYYVKNNGRHLDPEPLADPAGHTLFRPRAVNRSIRFFPRFVLQCQDVKKAYTDQLLPEAVEAIRRREDPNRPFYDSVSISEVKIPVSSELDDQSVWGIATWEGIDPRSDFFSVYVQGLTNAYRWPDVQQEQQLGAKAPFTVKTLQLNFWRRGDAIDPTEREIEFGLPTPAQMASPGLEQRVLGFFGLEERLDYQWIYR